MNNRTAALCTLLLLGACSPSKEEQTPPPKLFEAERSALDKAKTVDGTQQQPDEAQRKEIEKQTQ
jgi:hypothetical protein